MGIFAKEEQLIRTEFNKKFISELVVFDELLKTFSSFLEATSGKIKDNEYPNWTILMLLSQTLPLMNNAMELLSNGYLRSSEIMVRVVAEAGIMSAYFKEFPTSEIEYRTTNYRNFFKNHKIDDMLKKVENNGTIFISSKKDAKKVKWHQNLFNSLYKESSRFVHNNPNLIFDISKDAFNSKSETSLILGPQLYNDESLRMGVKRLFNSLLFSLVILGVSLNIYPDEKEKEIMNKASLIITSK